MRPRGNWLRAGIVTGVLVLAAFAQADEETVALDDVPAVVLDAVAARFKDATFIESNRETEDGAPVYEVAIDLGGQHVDVTLTPEGEIVLIETEIPAKDLTKAAAKSLAAKYPKATYKIVEEIVRVEKEKETLAFYEVLLVTADNRLIEAQVTAAGKIVNEEKKGSAEGEGDAEGDEHEEDEYEESGEGEHHD